MLICFSFVVCVLRLSLASHAVETVSDQIYQEIEALEDEIFKLNDLIKSSKVLKETLTTIRTCPKNVEIQDFSYPCWNIKGRCYCGFNTRKSWWAALHICRQYGMELLSLETQQEETDVFHDLQDKSGFNEFDYFTSGNRLRGDGTTWMWAGSGELLGRNIEWLNQPSSNLSRNYKNNCLNWKLLKAETPSRSWSALNCEVEQRYFICEFQMARPAKRNI